VKALRAAWLLALCFGARAALAQGVSEREHVPPDPPQTRMHPMTYREMTGMMGMDDRARQRKVMLDRVEWIDAAAATFAWDAAAWYGGDYHKLWLEAEGERASGATQDSRVELAWDRIITPWWSTRVGIRQDGGAGPARSWATFGVAGLAPGFVEVEVSAYVGEDGRTALRIASDYDLLFTQRLVLQPRIELNAYGKDDAQRLIGAGLADLALDLRLRYEFRREFAPYVGVRWEKRFGESADFARAAGDDPDEISLVAGLRLWF
jgi:copper resistance protein B